MANPCLNHESDLSSEIVLNLLKKSDDNVVLCSLPPVNPKGGEVYLFSPSGKENTKGNGLWSVPLLLVLLRKTILLCSLISV